MRAKDTLPVKEQLLKDVRDAETQLDDIKEQCETVERMI